MKIREIISNFDLREKLAIEAIISKSKSKSKSIIEAIAINKNNI